MSYTYERDWEFENDAGDSRVPVPLDIRHLRFEMDIDPPDPGRSGKYPEDCEPSYSGKADIIDAFITDDEGKEVSIIAHLSDYFSEDEVSEIESDALEAWKSDNSYDGPDDNYYDGPEVDYVV